MTPAGIQNSLYSFGQGINIFINVRGCKDLPSVVDGLDKLCNSCWDLWKCLYKLFKLMPNWFYGVKVR